MFYFSFCLNSMIKVLEKTVAIFYHDELSSFRLLTFQIWPTHHVYSCTFSNLIKTANLSADPLVLSCFWNLPQHFKTFLTHKNQYWLIFFHIFSIISVCTTLISLRFKGPVYMYYAVIFSFRSQNARLSKLALSINTAIKKCTGHRVLNWKWNHIYCHILATYVETGHCSDL